MAHAVTNRRSRKEERLEARLTPEQKNLITRAAALRGFSVTQFVVASAQQAASETIKNFELLTLHDYARDAYVLRGIGEQVAHALLPGGVDGQVF